MSKSDWIFLAVVLLVVAIVGGLLWRRKHKKVVLAPGDPGPTTSIATIVAKSNIKSVSRADQAAAKLQGVANASAKYGAEIGEKFGIPKNIAEPLGKYGNPVYLGTKGVNLAVDVGTAGAHGAKVAASSVAHAAEKVGSSIKGAVGHLNPFSW